MSATSIGDLAGDKLRSGDLDERMDKSRGRSEDGEESLEMERGEAGGEEEGGGELREDGPEEAGGGGGGR